MAVIVNAVRQFTAITYPRCVVSGIHAAVLGAPLAEAAITKAVLASDFLDWHTGFGLP